MVTDPTNPGGLYPVEDPDAELVGTPAERLHALGLTAPTDDPPG